MKLSVFVSLAFFLLLPNFAFAQLPPSSSTPRALLLHTPVETSLNPATDQLGAVIFNNLNEDIRNSHTLTLTTNQSEPRLVLRLTGVNPLPATDSGHETVMSVVVLVDLGNGSAPAYLTSYLFACGLNHLQACARTVVTQVIANRDAMFVSLVHQLKR